LGCPNQQLHRSGPKLGTALGYFADRVNRARPRRGARLDLDIEARRLVKALPQGGVVAGKLELRLAMELEHEFGLGTRGNRQCGEHKRKPGDAGCRGRHCA